MLNTTLRAHMEDHIPTLAGEPTVIRTDSTGVTFGAGYGGALGANSSHPNLSQAEPTGSLIPMGHTSPASPQPSGAWFGGSGGYHPDPALGGVAGRTDRLAYDPSGPATSTQGCNHELNGNRLRPGRPSLIKGGPVGTGGDLGQYLAVAMAQSTYDFPAQDLAQLNVLLGV